MVFNGTVSFPSVRLRNVGLVTKENISDRMKIHFEFLICSVSDVGDG
jgi:hypothetical protein